MSEAYEAQVRAMLSALGPGGTRDLAERALAYAWRMEPIIYHHLGGLAEVAALVDRSRPVVGNWNATPKLATPAPVFRLTATPVWDLRSWTQWGIGHMELMGPNFDPFREAA